jgi:metal-responsive CopG/Arc/MetJ family transcriptional regulator
MRIRTSLIIEESLMSKIDEIAGEKNRRSIIVETALREYVAREERKRRSQPAAPALKRTAVSGSR